MSVAQSSAASSRRYSPLAQLVLCRVREFFREPEALFWVYGFPILMTVALGIAFRNQPVEQQYAVDVVESPKAAATRDALESAPTIPSDSKLKLFRKTKRDFSLRTGKTDVDRACR